jgi:hypothetical protein
VSRVYAVEEGTARRFLVRLECDEPCCRETITPGPYSAQSGWTKRGTLDLRTRESLEWNHCPVHSSSGPGKCP